MKIGFRAAAAMSAATLLMSACGGGDSGSGSDSGGEGGELPTLTVADTNGAPLYFLTYAQQEGLCEDAGVQLDITSSSGGATVIPQLVSNDLDVAGSNVVSVLIGASRGLPLRMVAGGTSTSEEPEQDFSALMVAPDSTVTDISQLEGQQIASGRAAQHQRHRAGLDARGGGPSPTTVSSSWSCPSPTWPRPWSRGTWTPRSSSSRSCPWPRTAGSRSSAAPTAAVDRASMGTYVVTEQFAQENPDVRRGVPGVRPGCR